MQTPDIETLIETANAMADAARVPILRYFRSENLAAENKLASGFDPVTIADREAEEAMCAILAERRPDDGILGEETGTSKGISGLTWVLDPIDGTRSYLCGAPVFGVLIAVHDGEKPVFGMIDQPWTGERFLGAPGTGFAEMIRGESRRKLATRPARPLDQAILLSTFPEINTERDREGFQEVSKRARLTRYGLDCYGYALLALGQVDLVIEAGLQPYDIQGPMAVVQAAGGVVTNWRGGPADQGGQVIAAANPEIHREALALLAPFAT